MKKFVLAVVLVMMAGQAWGADCKQLATRYIKASQSNDYKTLLEMSSFYQNNAAVIKKNSPKYKVESELNELAESEKAHIVKWMFTPKDKWKIIEVVDRQVGKNTFICNVYVQNDYSDYADAPNSGNFFAKGKKYRSNIAVIYFDKKTGYTPTGPDVDGSMSKFWDSPLLISGLKYSYDKYTSDLELKFDINGGSDKVMGGNPPYSYSMTINNKPVIEFMGEMPFFTNDIHQFSDTTFSISAWNVKESRYSGFVWPAKTVFPLTLKLKIVDSSAPPKASDAEITIQNGKVANPTL